jgi:hypothetical protein
MVEFHGKITCRIDYFAERPVDERFAEENALAACNPNTCGINTLDLDSGRSTGDDSDRINASISLGEVDDIGEHSTSNLCIIT